MPSSIGQTRKGISGKTEGGKEREKKTDRDGKKDSVREKKTDIAGERLIQRQN